MFMDIFQVAASSTRLSVFFSVFPRHEFDVSNLTCSLRPGNPHGKEKWRESQVFNDKFLPGHSLRNVYGPGGSLMLTVRGHESLELHAVRTGFA